MTDYAALDHEYQKLLAPGPNTIATLLQRAGLFALPIDPGADAVELALRALRDMVNGADPLRVVGVRRAAVVLLTERGVKYADRLVGAAFKVADDDLLDHSAPATPDVQELLALGQAVLDAPNILERVAQYVIGQGYAGDTRAPKLVYLAITSRLLERPVNLFLSGPSAGGKNFTVRVVAPLFPEKAYYAIAGMSPLAVMYSPEDFAHRTIIISEASAFHEDGIGASLLRGLAWDAELKYDTVIDGESVRLQKAGPTGLITTGTRRLEAELATRLWTVPVPDDPTHTRAVLHATAVEVAGGKRPSSSATAFIAAQQWLATAGSRAVVVPFARELAGLVPVHEVRMRRDFTQLLTLIRTHALLHQRNRERDGEDRVIATGHDYAVVYDIVQPVFSASLSAGLTQEVRDTVLAVRTLAPDNSTVTVTQIADRLKLSPSATWRRVRGALEGRWLVNDEHRKHQPAKLRIGEPMPDVPGLPTPPELAQTCKRTTQPAGGLADRRLHERVQEEGWVVQTDDPDAVARAAMQKGA